MILEQCVRCWFLPASREGAAEHQARSGGHANLGAVTDNVISIRDARTDQLECFHEMEQDEGSRRYIIPYSVNKHRREFDKENVIYKSVFDEQRRLIGFVILVLDEDTRSIEQRRIVIAPKGRTYGSRALGLIEEICKQELGRERIWLDVFVFNQRARHVYENAGYTMCGMAEYRGEPLTVYEKSV